MLPATYQGRKMKAETIRDYVNDRTLRIFDGPTATIVAWAIMIVAVAYLSVRAILS